MKNETRGRKPTDDPKKRIVLYVETSSINVLGGDLGAQMVCRAAIKMAVSNIIKAAKKKN